MEEKKDLRLLLILPNLHHALWITGDVVLNSNCDLSYEFKSKATFLIFVISSADVQKLRV